MRRRAGGDKRYESMGYGRGNMWHMYCIYKVTARRAPGEWEMDMKIIAGFLSGKESNNGFLALNDEGDEWWIPSDKYTVKNLTTHEGILLLPSDYDFNTALSEKPV